MTTTTRHTAAAATASFAQSATPWSATSRTSRATAWGLAALVTLSVLAGLDHTADQAYDQAAIAQGSSISPTLASNGHNNTNAQRLAARG
jgi:hypothetical protein